MTIEIQDRVREVQRFEFLKRVCEIVHEEHTRYVPAGELGTELGLPYEDALRITDELQELGFLHRVGDLAPPVGPRVHITSRGVREVHGHRAA